MRADEINRLGISLVPEGRRLFPNLTVEENLKLAARRGGASQEEICDLFPKLRILMRSLAENLSGGERQMVAISRALMVPSRLILLDEPFEGLAPAVVQEVREAVAKLTTKASLVIVEHHAESVLAMADRAYVLVNGKVAFSGDAETLAADTALQERLLGITKAADLYPERPASCLMARDIGVNTYSYIWSVPAAEVRPPSGEAWLSSDRVSAAAAASVVR